MKKRFVLFPVILILSLTLIKCIDPFFPKLENFQSLLVVDALLTDEDAPAYVRITRTTETLDEDMPMVTGAIVSITDDLGNSTSLIEVSEGNYKSDVLELRGTAGREYTLRIRTADGKEYESSACLLNEVRDIDTVYFGQANQTTDDGEVRARHKGFYRFKRPFGTQILQMGLRGVVEIQYPLSGDP